MMPPSVFVTVSLCLFMLFCVATITGNTREPTGGIAVPDPRSGPSAGFDLAYPFKDAIEGDSARSAKRPPAAGPFLAAGSPVTMADGTSKSIDEIRVGDRVLGQNGAINPVLSLEPHPLGKNRVYSLNGGQAFITANHPVWTAEGWKVIDPGSARSQQSGAPMARLGAGDILAWLNLGDDRSLLRPARFGPSDPAGRLSPAPAHPVQPAWTAAATTVYRLTLGGDYTFFAGGYLVRSGDE